ncbi:MAG: tRNA pseudouridine(55) synthase TruB [Ruminococcaceae bacterium]|nr:tRNA pseudouridine(55) synthase TruB [Oscillospiraceae bacterium]
MSSAEPSGVLIVNKHSGVTSHDIVGKVRRLYHTRRVGHTGTLDPMASGVLVVLVGRAAKASEYLTSHDKRYLATLRLGVVTDTEDSTGTVLSSTDACPSFEEVKQAASAFLGAYDQIPPMYSALKVDGKKLCDMARRGEEIERKARRVYVHELDVTPTESERDYRLSVHCSSGTYVRTLCADIGQCLGVGGIMASLVRTAVADFSLEQAVSIAELETMSDDERLSRLIPTEALFASLPALSLPTFYETLCRNGCEIYQKKLGSAFGEGQRVRLYGKNGFFALGEVRSYPDGSAIKAVKQFDLP